MKNDHGRRGQSQKDQGRLAKKLDRGRQTFENDRMQQFERDFLHHTQKHVRTTQMMHMEVFVVDETRI